MPKLSPPDSGLLGERACVLVAPPPSGSAAGRQTRPSPAAAIPCRRRLHPTPLPRRRITPTGRRPPTDRQHHRCLTSPASIRHRDRRPATISKLAPSPAPTPPPKLLILTISGPLRPSSIVLRGDPTTLRQTLVVICTVAAPPPCLILRPP